MARNNENELLNLENVIEELTLDETYDHLKDIQAELHENIQQLLADMSDTNNYEVQQILPHSAITPDYILKKQKRLVQELLKHDHGYDRRIDPIYNTIDAKKTTIWELEQEITNARITLDKLRDDISILKKNIACLESEKKGLERMKETYVNTVERNSTGNIINSDNVKQTKELFLAVKADLGSLVDIMFPQYQDFKQILGELSKAYMKGGDDVYVDVGSGYIDCVKFMVEADIATYHPNDKNKLRLMDLL
ncbi:hypothetical protein PV327_004892 [Microctonus hyperodae]|uniref:Uncharacterized protein n=1 Tax=Microctonus hyperodae TaxID=165561 RepID=A0AA39KN63_MICHY|nr:hypothetical protein PV327_004892 [Microctonus hyperodae]